jgi:predicted peptidase
MRMKQLAHVRETAITRTLRLPYLLSLPADYSNDPEKKWPLMLFLHGAGERGLNDMVLLRKHGIPRVVEERDLPFITVSPQCPPNSWWADYRPELLALIDHVSGTHRVDATRVYLTGLSMGGFGSWHLAAENPQRFAAVVPICGGGVWAYGFPERVLALKNTPVWAFHGAKDPTVPLAESETLVNKLQACGGKVRFTIYADAGHDSWTETYNNPDLYAWLLEQHI